MHEHNRVPWEDRWCFKCRRRLPHDAVLFVADDGEDDWYGPQWEVQCHGCGGDFVHFPGTWDGPTLEAGYA